MRFRMVTAFACFCLAVSGAIAQARYSIVRLPGLVSGWGPSVKAINNNGVAVGSSKTSLGPDHAVKWDGSTTPSCTDLGNLGTWGVSRAYGINDSDEVCGVGQASASDPYQPVVWNGTTMTNILPSGAYAGWAYGINNKGHVVGHVYTSGYANRYPFFYDGSSSYDLISGGGYSDDQMVSINDDDVALGYQYTSYNQVALYKGVGTRTVIYSGGVSPTGMAVNHIGQTLFIYGSSTTWNNLDLWNPAPRSSLSGTTQALSFPSSASTTDQTGMGMNAYGDIVATFIANSGGSYVPYVRIKSDQQPIWEDLNTLIPSGSGWVLWGVSAINDKGQIVGYGRYTSGGTTTWECFRLDPTSQPNR